MDISKIFNSSDDEQRDRDLCRNFTTRAELRDFMEKAADYGGVLSTTMGDLLVSLGRIVRLSTTSLRRSHRFTQEEIDSLTDDGYECYQKIINDDWFYDEEYGKRGLTEELRIYDRVAKKLETLVNSAAGEAYFSIPFAYAVPSLVRRFYEDLYNAYAYDWEHVCDNYKKALAKGGKADTHEDWEDFRIEVNVSNKLYDALSLIDVFERRKERKREEIRQRVQNMGEPERASYDEYMDHKNGLIEKSRDYFKCKKTCTDAYFEYLKIFTGKKMPDDYAIHITAEDNLYEYNQVRSIAYYWNVEEWKEEYDRLLDFDEYKFELVEVKNALDDVNSEIMSNRTYFDNLESEGAKIAEEVKKEKSRRDWQTFAKVALGAVSLIGGFSALASGGGMFSTPNPSSGEQWISKETGEIFDYDPRL
ncbi:MAG: hypothetical protein FWE32_08095 [Oscillospiraceae bacterium]|nr:hypothetical protein [Oscillospiraceae bacterium]